MLLITVQQFKKPVKTTGKSFVNFRSQWKACSSILHGSTIFFFSKKIATVNSLTDAFDWGDGAVGCGIVVGDDLAGGIEQCEIYFHGEVTVLRNVFDGAGDELATVVFTGGKAVVFDEQIRVFGLPPPPGGTP